MIVCKQCGHHNEDNDTFCGSCGKFLEWSGERVAVAEPEPPPAAPEPEPEPARVGFMDRVKQAVGIDEGGAAAPSSAAPPPTPTPAAPVPVVAAAPPAAAPARPAEPVLAGVAAAPTPVAAAPVAPPIDPVSRPPSAAEPASRRPTAVAPVRRTAGPRTMEAPTRRHPGDLICGQCGEGNDPERHFCRRCGTSLDEAIAVSLPWYRRFFNRLFGGRQREAGWRPHRVGPPNVMGGVMRVVRLAILALIIIGALAFLLLPPFHDRVVSTATTAFTAVRKTVHPNYDPVYPTSATASTATAGHLPGLAIDRQLGTYWAATAADRTPVLVLHFAQPVDLASIGFTSGASGTAPADAFLGQPRPQAVHLVFSDKSTADLTLKDQDKAQFNNVTATKVTFVEIHVQSTYAPAGASPSSVAITEVEFRIKD